MAEESDGLIGRLMEEYLQARQRGEHPPVEDYLPRVPAEQHEDLRAAYVGASALAAFIPKPS